MSRTADHGLRRRQLTTAVAGLVRDEGESAVTIARTAERAGVSVGLVQHYFPAKGALLQATHQSVLDAVNARVAAIVAAGERQGRRVEDMMLDALEQLLPLDETRRTECAVTLTFHTAGLHAPAHAVAARESMTSLLARLRQAVANGRVCGEVESSRADDDLAAELLLATLGAAAWLSLDESAAAVVRAVVAATVHRVFSGECHHPDALEAASSATS